MELMRGDTIRSKGNTMEFTVKGRDPSYGDGSILNLVNEYGKDLVICLHIEEIENEYEIVRRVPRGPENDRDNISVRDLDGNEFIAAFQVIQERAHGTAVEKGFWNQHSNLIELLHINHSHAMADYVQLNQKLKAAALIQSEVSEAVEAARKDLNDDKLTHRSGFEVELADAIIRIMDVAGYYKLDIAGAIIEKMAYNAGRPYLHGKLA